MAMLETAEKIMNNMSLNGTHIPNVTLKPFSSYGTQATRHDIVVSAFTLSELTEPALRKSTLEHLWESTNDMLVRQNSQSDEWVFLIIAPALYTDVVDRMYRCLLIEGHQMGSEFLQRRENRFWDWISI